MDFPVGHRHRDDRGQREGEHGEVADSFWRFFALNPLRRLRQNLAATEPGQAVERMDVGQLPVSEGGGGIFDQVGAKRRAAAGHRPGPPRQRAGSRGLPGLRMTRNPGGEQGTRDDAHQDRNLDGHADPQPKTAGHSREDEPAARRFYDVRRGVCPESGREQQHAAEGENLGQAAVVGRAGEIPRGKRKDGDKTD